MIVALDDFVPRHVLTVFIALAGLALAAVCAAAQPLAGPETTGEKPAGTAEPVTEAVPSGAPVAAPVAAAIGATLQELLLWADAHNQELAAMGYEIDAANARIVPAGALPDPTLRLTFMDIGAGDAPDDVNQWPEDGSGTQYRLGQTFPWWGKRALRKEVATAQVEQVKGLRQAVVAGIHARIKSAYARYYEAAGLIRLNEEILQLLSGLEEVAHVRYAGGLAPQQDVIRAQVEKTMLRSELIELDTERHHAMTSLNVAMGRQQSAPIAEPQTLPPITPQKLDGAALEARIRRTSPLLAMQSAQVTAAEANRRLVEKNRYPDVTLMVAPTSYGSGIDSWEAMVEFNIPIRFDIRRAQENEAEAMMAAAEERRRAAELEISGGLQESLAALEAAASREQLITDTLVPQAELTLHAALAGYETGQVDFATLVEAQRAVKQARQDRLRSQVEQQLRVAEIESMIGEEL
jgi:outer membrane protein TolC